MRRCVAVAILLLACGPKHAPRTPAGIAGLLAYVPADAPFVVASLEPWTLDDVRQWKEMYGPVFREAMHTKTDSQGMRILAAIDEELGDNVTEQRIAELGFSPRPHAVFYPLGSKLVVLRLELRDARTALQTLDRIAKRAGQPLGPAQRVAGFPVYRAKNGTAFVFADDQLVVVLGDRPVVDRGLGSTLQRPARAFDERTLRDLIARHHLDPHLAAMLDTAQLVRMAAQDAGLSPSGACASELAAFTGLVPRVVGSLSSTRKRQGMRVVAELAPALRAELAATKVPLPAQAEAFATHRIATFALGVDLERGQRVLRGIAETMQRAGTACGWQKLREGAEGMTRAIGEPIPPQIAQLRGGVASLLAYAPSGWGALPARIEGFAVLYGTLPHELVDVAQKAGVPADGQLHPLNLAALGLPGLPRVIGMVGERIAAIAIGDRGEQLLPRALAAKSDAPAPLFRMRVDYGRFLEITKRSEGQDRAVAAAMAKIYGDTDWVLDVTDEGLVTEVGWNVK